MKFNQLQRFRGYPVHVRTIRIAEHTIRVLGPENFEELVDDPRVHRRFEQDEFMPYWAEFWPACVLLAREVATWPVISESSPRPTVLEFGCGLGLVALVAAARGYDVVASDYEDDALGFVELSARFNNIPCPRLEFVDWRRQYDALRCDRLIASEVLYETRNLEPIAQFIDQHLTDDGEAILLDSYRSVADAFPRTAVALGLRVEVEPAEGVDSDGDPIRGRFFRVRRTG